MAKSKGDGSKTASEGAGSLELREAAVRGERRLLEAEWEAEQRLATAQAKLAKAEARLAKRQIRLAQAEDSLRQHQTARAAGPLAETV